MLSRPLAIAITIVITVVWLANVVVGFLYPDRHDATLNAIFAIVVGVVYGLTPKRDVLSRARRGLARRIEGTAGEGEGEEPAEEDASPRGDDR